MWIFLFEDKCITTWLIGNESRTDVYFRAPLSTITSNRESCANSRVLLEPTSSGEACIPLIKPERHLIEVRFEDLDFQKVLPNWSPLSSYANSVYSINTSRVARIVSVDPPQLTLSISCSHHHCCQLFTQHTPGLPICQNNLSQTLVNTFSRDCNPVYLTFCFALRTNLSLGIFTSVKSSVGGIFTFQSTFCGGFKRAANMLNAFFIPIQVYVYI